MQVFIQAKVELNLQLIVKNYKHFVQKNHSIPKHLQFQLNRRLNKSQY